MRCRTTCNDCGSHKMQVPEGYEKFKKEVLALAELHAKDEKKTRAYIV